MKKQILQSLQIHRKMLDTLEETGVEIIADSAQLIIDSLSAGGVLYLCGNGGSAADAQHIAGEFVGRFLRERKALPAVALSTDTSVITAIGNDYSFDDIFVRQADALMKQGDILWAFSTSGSSANVIKAAEKAKEKNARVIAFTGKADSPLEKISDICLCATNPYTSTSQEVHMLAYHIICELIDVEFVKS